MSIQDNFRLAMRRYIYSVSIMSNKDNDDNPNAITVSSVTSISMDPPSLLICINKSSRIHNSIELESRFCINLLNNKQELSNREIFYLRPMTCDTTESWTSWLQRVPLK